MRSTPSPHAAVVVLLACLHTQKYAPAPVKGDVLYCRRCSDWFKVITDVVNWHARCTGCRMGRWYGADRQAAYRCATRHADKLGHTVEVRERASDSPDVITAGDVDNDLVTLAVKIGNSAV